MLPNEEIEAYLQPLTEEQAANIQGIRSLIAEICPYLREEIDNGKWFRGLLTYYAEDGMFVFALGPRSGGDSTFHMMAYYGSKDLQERHGEAFKKLLSGKSCIRFKSLSQVPEDALKDIMASTPKFLELAKIMYAKRDKKKK